MNRRSLLLLLVWIVLPWSTVGWAADKAAPDPEIEMKEVEIRGELDRPGVFYIIPRREVSLDLGPQTKDYRSEILTPLLPSEVEGEDRGSGEGER